MNRKFLIYFFNFNFYEPKSCNILSSTFGATASWDIFSFEIIDLPRILLMRPIHIFVFRTWRRSSNCFQIRLGSIDWATCTVAYKKYDNVTKRIKSSRKTICRSWSIGPNWYMRTRRGRDRLRDNSSRGCHRCRARSSKSQKFFRIEKALNTNPAM